MMLTAILLTRCQDNPYLLLLRGNSASDGSCIATATSSDGLVAIVTRPSILVVDDEATILELIRDILEGEGFTVLIARSGTAALRLLQHTSVTLVLTDLMMPQLSGLELAQRLSADPKTAGIPLILMSAAMPSGVSDLFADILHKRVWASDGVV